MPSYIIDGDKKIKLPPHEMITFDMNRILSIGIPDKNGRIYEEGAIKIPSGIKIPVKPAKVSVKEITDKQDHSFEEFLKQRNRLEITPLERYYDDEIEDIEDDENLDDFFDDVERLPLYKKEEPTSLTNRHRLKFYEE